MHKNNTHIHATWGLPVTPRDLTSRRMWGRRERHKRSLCAFCSVLPVSLSCGQTAWFVACKASALLGVYILIGAGALMMLVGFLGCCGAVQESQCMLGLFFGFLLVIFAIEIAAAIWGYSHKDEVIKEIQEFYKDTYNKLKTKDEPQRETLKAIHYALNCCGVAGGVEQFISDICPKKDVLETITMKVNSEQYPGAPAPLLWADPASIRVTE
ncbi:hypothetical protein P7K49_019149 [Saguinus oedipus]|uniref:Tetraspanin n=2 Tax=Callitrichinae TaxID=9480 RepID=A0ABQ9UYD9_SAGOE|nr:hypothetical protein P7K49_019149 [Saguinus oedipus]